MTQPYQFQPQHSGLTRLSGDLAAQLMALGDLQTALNLKAPLVSPVFTTPVLGVATGTSLVLSGNLSAVAGTFTDLLLGSASTTARATLRVPHGVAPTTPTNGDTWSTSAGFFGRANGVTQGPFGSGNAQTANPLSQFAATTSGQLAGVMSDETGSGALVFANTPTLVTPVLGAATGTSLALSGNLSAVAGTFTGAITAPSLAASGSGITTIGNGSGGVFLTGRITGNDIATTDSTYAGLTRLGHFAAFQNTGADVTANGAFAAFQNTGADVTANGSYAAYINIGAAVTANGYYAAFRNTGADVAANGAFAAFLNTGSNVTANGSHAAYQNSGSNVTAIGFYAAFRNTGANGVFVGYGAGQSNSVNNRFEVKQSPCNATPLLVGDFANNRLGIGVSSLSGAFNLQVAGSIGATGNLSAAAITASGAITGTLLQFAGYTTALLPLAALNARAITYDLTLAKHVGCDGATWSPLY